MTITETITSGQKKQIVRFCEDALEDFQCGKGVAQRAIERGNEPQARFFALIKELGELPYSDEQVKSSFGYPEGFRFRTPEEQLEVWEEHFPELDASHVLELVKSELPEGAEAWGVIPKPSKVAQSYYQALEVMLNLIVEEREFKNWREGKLTDQHLRLTEQTAQAHAKLDEQPGDFWVIPFQFGLKHRGRSVRRARVCFADNEFGLGPLEVAALLLTHPERISGVNQLHGIDCAGCDYRSAGDDDFWACLRFCWSAVFERLALNCNNTGSAIQKWVSASGFVAEVWDS